MLVVTRAILLVLLVMSPSLAATHDWLLTRVIDTGPGHASVTVIPGGFYMVYDTGHWDHDANVSEKVLELIPGDEAIDLLVLSHSDADHLSATDEIFESRRVHTVLRTGLRRTSKAWKDADGAIRQAARAGTTEVFNLRQDPMAPGKTFHLGEATVTFLAGVDCPNHYDSVLPGSGDCTKPGRSMARNAGSIVVRLEYAGRSILFTGDAVGRHDGAEPIATEAELISRQSKFPIASDVIIAPHHGADNGSSTAFIHAVSPKWVIFPAGHETNYQHPRQSTACRYLDQGVKLARILRTDRGDNEGGKEWSHGATDTPDPAGDDDIDIIIGADSALNVKYRNTVPADGGAGVSAIANPSRSGCEL